MSLMQCKLFHRAVRSLVACSVTAFSLFTFAQDSTNSPPAAPRRPSVILILADKAGMDDIGCYGSTKVKTPNLDQLAAEGARFTCFYAGSPAQSPAQAALMLGLNTGHLNIRDDSSGTALGSDDQTFSQLLLQSGYRTALIGKWILSDGASGLPKNKGFDQFAGFLSDAEAENDYSEFIYRYESTAINGTHDGKVQVAGNEGGKKGQYIPDLLTKAALNFIRISKPAEFNHYRPFFLMLAYPALRAENGTNANSRLDGYVSQVLDHLKTSRIENNTIVIFMGDKLPKRGSDNNSLKEDELRVPLIVRWPAHLKPATVSEPLAAWDIFPTMADAARTQCPTNTDGISFYPMLRGRTQTNHHEFLYWEIHDAARGSQQAGRMGDWKAVRKVADGALELYDLKSDPGEKKNVADKHPDVIANFEKHFKTARNEDKRWPLKKPAERPSEKGGKS